MLDSAITQALEKIAIPPNTACAGRSGLAAFFAFVSELWQFLFPSLSLLAADKANLFGRRTL